MTRYVLGADAQRDLQHIHAYIAYESRPRADRVLNRIIDAIRKLARDPWLGKRRDDLTNLDVCFYSVSNYYVIYMPGTEPLIIVRVLHMARDVATALEEP